MGGGFVPVVLRALRYARIESVLGENEILSNRPDGRRRLTSLVIHSPIMKKKKNNRNTTII